MMYKHEFEITIWRKSSESNYWPLRVRVNQLDGIASHLPEMKFQLDMTQIRGTQKDIDYGTLLGRALFEASFLNADSATTTFRERLKEELGKIESNSNENRLRILLSIDDAEDKDLNTLQWQKLCASIDTGSWSFLAKDQRVAFSMYIPTAISRNFPPLRQDQLRALILVASPFDLESKGLSSFPVEDIIVDLQKVFNEKAISHTFLVNTNGFDAPTLENLSTKLTEAAEKDKKPYNLLHIVSHGTLGADNDITLYWADEHNIEALVSGTELVEKLRAGALPHFAFLCACNSADPTAETALPGETALGGLAQRLIRELGMPAVIGMTRQVSIKTALPLAKEFYSYLQATGEIDVALQASIKSAGLEDRQDILTAPILFSRLGGRPLFISSARLRKLNESQIKQGIENLDVLLEKRAPKALMLRKDFEKQKMQVDNSDTQLQALKELNNLCYQVLGITFDELATGTQPTEYNVKCPFPGLSSFADYKFHNFFFGRTKLIDDLKKALNADNKFLAVIGPSGSGKSSVVLAGLLPKLKKEDSSLQSNSMTPGDKPITRLKTEIEKLEGQSFVLVIDQFEELFTLCSDNSKRKEFIAQLLELSQNQKVVITMRADFFGECAYYENLKEKINKNSILVGPMIKEELSEVIQLQAQAANLRFESGVNTNILTEVENEPGMMPLLQFALEKLYEQRRGNWLCIEEYKAIGGVQEAIATVANNYLEKDSENLELTPKKKKQLVKDIFLKLVHVDERDLEISGENPKDTRKRIFLKDLEVIGDARKIRQIVDELASERLIVKTGGASNTEDNTIQEADVQVEVAHEALIQKWTQLKTWLNENRADLKLIQQINREAEEWQKHSQDNDREDLLRLRGILLEDALKNKSLEKSAENYVEACVELRDRTAREREARNITFIVNSLLNKNPTHSLRMAQTAYRLDDKHRLLQVSEALRLAYYSAIENKSAVYLVDLQHNDLVTTAIYSPPNGQKILTVSHDGTAKLWNTRGQLLKVMEHSAKIESASFSHDGSKIITVGYEYLVKMWDGDGNHIKDLVGHKNSEYNNVRSVAFSPDDQTIVTVGADYKVIMWDGQGNKKKELNDHRRTVNYVTFSPNGKYFVTCGSWRDSTAKLYTQDGNLIASLEGDTCTSKKEQAWECAITSAAFSPDNQLLVTTSRDSTAKIWDITGQHRKTLTQHQSDVNKVVFSSDGNFVTCSDDGQAIIWDQQGNRLQTINHGSSVRTVAFSPDGKQVVTSGSDNTAKLWDLQGKLLATYKGHNSDINSVAFSPDGQYLVTAAIGNTAKLWRVQPLQMPTFSHQEEVITAKFTPDGSKVLTAGNDLVVKLWDIKTNQLLRAYTSFGPDRYRNKRIYSLDVSPDGKRFITTGTDYTIRIWELNSAQPVKEWDGGHLNSCTPEQWCGATNARYSPDGNYIITCDFGGKVKLWDSEGNFLKELPGHKSEVNGVDISPDNKYIATASHDNTVKVWDWETSELPREFSGHTKAVLKVNFAPDGKSLLSASEDHTAKLWNLETGEIILNLNGHGDQVRTAAFSSTGEYIITASYDKTAKIWDREGNLVNSLEGHTKFLRSAYFSPDGQTVVTASGDNTARVWPQAEAIYSWLEDTDIYQLTKTDLKEYGIDVAVVGI